MKKLLEADLISIAHRILKLKGRDDIDALLKEAQLVTQKLVILKFYEDHVNLIKNEISPEDFQERLTVFNQNQATDLSHSIPANKNNKPYEISDGIDNIGLIIDESQVENESYISEETATKILEVTEKNDAIEKNESLVNDEKNEIISDELVFDEKVSLTVVNENETQSEKSAKEENEIISEVLFKPQNIEPIPQDSNEVEDQTPVQSEIQETKEAEKKLEDLFQDFAPFDFVKREETSSKSVEKSEVVILECSTDDHNTSTITENKTEVIKTTETRVFSLNDRLTGSLKIGLNDKIGFVKHLFDGSEEDYARVISQLNTFHSHEEAINFIENFVKPDYNNWENKDDYTNRFLSILERSY